MAQATLPFLAELTSVMNDTSVRKAKAIQLLKPYWVVNHNYFSKTTTETRIGKAGWHCTGTSHITCVFGEFTNPLTTEDALPLESMRTVRYVERGYAYGLRYEKSGIEILNAQPNATGSTYSRKCRITVKELKEACKLNGIKTTGLDKRGLLSALMKA